MAAIHWTGAPAEIEERNGVFILTLASGDETFSFAMTMRLAAMLGARAVRAVEDLAAERGEIVSLRSVRAAKRRAKQ